MSNLIILFKVNYICWDDLGMAHGSHISVCSRDTAGIIDIWHEAASETIICSQVQFFVRFQGLKEPKPKPRGGTRPPDFEEEGTPMITVPPEFSYSWGGQGGTKIGLAVQNN